jgi:hypothetical protein
MQILRYYTYWQRVSKAIRSDPEVLESASLAWKEAAAIINMGS